MVDFRVGTTASPEDLSDLSNKTIQPKLTLLHREDAYAVADSMLRCFANLQQGSVFTKHLDYKGLQELALLKTSAWTKTTGVVFKYKLDKLWQLRARRTAGQTII